MPWLARAKQTRQASMATTTPAALRSSAPFRLRMSAAAAFGKALPKRQDKLRTDTEVEQTATTQLLDAKVCAQILLWYMPAGRHGAKCHIATPKERRTRAPPPQEA